MRMLLRYPSPQPHPPQTFVQDALYLQQNATLEGGSSIILKYSDRQPQFLKHLSQPSGRPGSPSKSHPRRGFSDFSSGAESSLPVRPRAGNNARSFDSILQDVSQGIQRRTETWGVAKAVRGAVTDARRNMNSMQWEPRPRATRSDNVASPHHRDIPWAHEPTVNPKTAIDNLEERNMALAKMLGQASADLRTHMLPGERPDPAAADAIKQALAKLESVQICLENSSIPLGSTDTPSSEKSGGTQKPSHERTKETASSSAKVNQPSTDQPPTNTISPKTIPSPTKQPKPTPYPQPKTSIPTRPAPRRSLANSEFSWMLGNGDGNGGNRQVSSFASSASVPPEQTRNQNHDTRTGTKTKQNALFGNGEDARSSRGEKADVAMNSLRGRKG